MKHHNSIILMRCGPSRYTQGSKIEHLRACDDLCMSLEYHEGEILPPETEKELKNAKQRAIDLVKQKCEEIAELLKPDITVHIFTAPVARDLQTAIILRDTLTERNFGFTFSTCPEIGEIANFSRQTFRNLVFGGKEKIEIDKKEVGFEIPRCLSNPANLDFVTYIRTDYVHCIPPLFLHRWPEPFVKKLKSVERFSTMTQRFMREVVKKAKNFPNDHIVFVTDEFCLIDVAERFTNGRITIVPPASFIHIKMNYDDNMIVKRVGEITDGDSKSDFFSKWITGVTAS